HPECARNLDSHVFRNLVDLPRFVAQQVKANDFKDALVVTPTAHIHVLNVREFSDQACRDAGLFPNFAQRSIQSFFTRVDQTLRQAEYGFVLRARRAFGGSSLWGRWDRVALELDPRNPPRSVFVVDDYSSGRDFTQHTVRKLQEYRNFVTYLM